MACHATITQPVASCGARPPCMRSDTRMRGAAAAPWAYQLWPRAPATPGMKGARSALAVRAQRPSSTRLATQITTVPRRLDLYFAGRPARQAMWATIFFASGFYSANTVSLSFGALAINDVVAAAITVGFCEVASYLYYRAERKTLKLTFLNFFKMGVIMALTADSMKLGG